MKEKNFEFDVALSFAGENRNYVEKVAQSLKIKGVKVFYDMFEEVNLWGKNLYEYLSEIYQNKARYTVIFISKFYNKKLWTNHERESMQARAFQESKEYILPARFDDTEIPGILRTIGYVNLNYKTAEEFASLIESKVLTNKTSDNMISTTWSKVSTLIKPKPYIFMIRIKNADGVAVQDAKVVLVADNNTYLETSTGNDGRGHFVMKTTRSYTVLISHPNYSAFVMDRHNPKEDLEIILQQQNAVGSTILYKGGVIAGLLGQIEPMINKKSKMNLYADNIAINGGENQPVTIELNKSLSLEDKEGTLLKITFIFFRGRITVLEYTKPSMITH